MLAASRDIARDPAWTSQGQVNPPLPLPSSSWSPFPPAVMQNTRRPARINFFHGPKQKVLGGSGKAPPAWRTPTPSSNPNANVNPNVQGSKILISRLPPDVDVKEVEELFRQTVGPLKDVTMIYNSQGVSKGMAIVEFAKPGDAVVARRKYHGKIVDARRPIKIEIVSDSDVLSTAAPPPSLFARLGVPNGGTAPPPTAKPAPQTATSALNQPLGTQTNGPRRRYKKGPKRLKKRMENAANAPLTTRVERTPATKDQLDQEMEDYRASALGVAL